MKVIVEGFDNTGKSTLIGTLSDSLNLPVFWAGPRPEDDCAAVQNCMQQLAMESCILDRATCVSRLCYEVSDSIKVAHYNTLLNYLSWMKKDCIFIRCTNQSGVEVLKDHDTEEFQTWLANNKERINGNYNRLFSRIKHFEYDYAVNSIDEVVSYVVNHKNSKK